MGTLETAGEIRMFIFTEIVRCGLIGKIALKTYHTFHTHPVHVFGRKVDFDEIEYHPNNVLHELGDDHVITKAFDNGHYGTAMLWATVFRNAPDDEIVHFDSDVIFRGDMVTDILQKLHEGYDLVGGSRNYKHNPHGKSHDHVRHLPDTVATACFGIRKSIIELEKYDFDTLRKMMQGAHNPLGHPFIDFFDPVSFVVMHNGGRVFYVDHDIIGACNPEGSRMNKYGKINTLVDLGDKFCHFASVGSGLNFVRMKEKKQANSVPEGYVLFAIKKFDLYLRVFYNSSCMPESENAENILYLDELRHIFADVLTNKT